MFDDDDDSPFAPQPQALDRNSSSIARRCSQAGSALAGSERRRRSSKSSRCWKMRRMTEQHYDADPFGVLDEQVVTQQHQGQHDPLGPAQQELTQQQPPARTSLMSWFSSRTCRDATASAVRVATSSSARTQAPQHKDTRYIYPCRGCGLEFMCFTTAFCNGNVELTRRDRG